MLRCRLFFVKVIFYDCAICCRKCALVVMQMLFISCRLDLLFNLNREDVKKQRQKNQLQHQPMLQRRPRIPCQPAAATISRGERVAKQAISHISRNNRGGTSRGLTCQKGIICTIKITILSHQSKIATKIEFEIRVSEHEDWKKLGRTSFDSNSDTNYSTRELKQINVPF